MNKLKASKHVEKLARCDLVGGGTIATISIISRSSRLKENGDMTSTYRRLSTRRSRLSINNERVFHRIIMRLTCSLKAHGNPIRERRHEENSRRVAAFFLGIASIDMARAGVESTASDGNIQLSLDRTRLKLARPSDSAAPLRR